MIHPARRFAFIIALCCFALVMVADMAATPAGAQSADGMPAAGHEQVQLTPDSARNALLAYRDLKQRFEGEAPPAGETAAWGAALAASADYRAIVQEHGFEDPDLWYRTMISVVIAHNTQKDGRLEEMRRSMEEIQNNDQIPDSVKEQVLARYAPYIPSDENLAVASELAGDPDYAALMAEVVE